MWHPAHEAVRNTSGTDNDIAQLYATFKEQRHTGARLTVDALAALGALPYDIEADTATDAFCSARRGIVGSFASPVCGVYGDVGYDWMSYLLTLARLGVLLAG